MAVVCLKSQTVYSDMATYLEGGKVDSSDLHDLHAKAHPSQALVDPLGSRVALVLEERHAMMVELLRRYRGECHHHQIRTKVRNHFCIPLMQVSILIAELLTDT